MDQLQKLGSGHSGVQGESCVDSDLPGWLRPRRGTAADPRGSADRSAPADALLSIGHNPTRPEIERVAKPKQPPKRALRIWRGAARADFPGIPNLNPNAEHQQTPKVVPRGAVLTFSRRSRKNLSLSLATVLVEPQAYTMALTLPGHFEHLSRPWVKRCFLRLCDQFTAKASRNPIFRRSGFYWKQELQKRGALHFHLLLYGIEDGLESSIRRWIIETWNKLICDHRGTVLGDREKHLWLHSKPENFQPVRNMHGYFAKYLGKDEADLIADEPIPGRWWGKCNRKALPFADCSELAVPAPVAVLMHRCARRITRERMHEAHHRSVMRKIGLVDGKGEPLVSRFGLLHARNNRKLRDLEVGESCSPSEFAQLLALTARVLVHQHHKEGISEPLRIGKVKITTRANHAKRTLLGKEAPITAQSILRYAAKVYRQKIENEPF